MSNDTLARLVRHGGPLQWVMWECECSPRCHELVALTLREFDDLRGRGDAVLAAPHRSAAA